MKNLFDILSIIFTILIIISSLIASYISIENDYHITVFFTIGASLGYSLAVIYITIKNWLNEKI